MGPVRRLIYPVEAGLNLVTRTGSRVLNTSNNLLKSVGRAARGVVANTTSAVNNTGSRMLTGRNRRNTRKNKGRK
jgi:hypothetical protein